MNKEYSVVNRILEINELNELKAYLSELPDIDSVRTNLLDEFLKYARYSNVTEWNRAVRLCECLAIVGWGEHEGLEAVKTSYFNGNPNTFFINRYGQLRFRDAVWSKRKEGLAIDGNLTFFHKSADAPSMTCESIHGTGVAQNIGLCSQRNWIPKNPIGITRGLANCYENSKSVIDSMETKLKGALHRRMRPELYGNSLDMILITCSFSFCDGPHCKTNYIIADEARKLKQKDFYPALLEMFSEKEIEANGYFLRNRFTYGPFRHETGLVRVGIVFEKEFSLLSHQIQKETLSRYLLEAVEHVSARLARKLDYDFALMIQDFKAVLEDWCQCKDSL